MKKATPKKAATTQEHPCFLLSLAGYDLVLAVSLQPLGCKKTCQAHTLTNRQEGQILNVPHPTQKVRIVSVNRSFFFDC